MLGYCNFSNKQPTCLTYKTSKQVNLEVLETSYNQFVYVCSSCKESLFKDFNPQLIQDEKVRIESVLSENKRLNRVRNSNRPYSYNPTEKSLHRVEVLDTIHEIIKQNENITQIELINKLKAKGYSMSMSGLRYKTTLLALDGKIIKQTINSSNTKDKVFFKAVA